MVTRSIEGAQRKVEGHHFDIRKHLLDYDDVMNQQRHIIYGMRRKVLEDQDVERTYLDMLGDLVSAVLDTHVPADIKKESWNLDGLNTALAQQFGLNLDFKTFPHIDEQIVTDAVSKAVKEIFDRQKTMLGEHYSQIQKMVLLQAIDQRWKEHLLHIDRLKEGINLRGYAQKDPIVEYKKEAFAAFEQLNHYIKVDSIEKFLKVQLVSPDAAQKMRQMLETPDFQDLQYQGGDENAAGGAISAPGGVVRDGGARPSAGGPQRMRMTGSPGTSDEGPKLNRAQRRQMEKKRR